MTSLITTSTGHALIVAHRFQCELKFPLGPLQFLMTSLITTSTGHALIVAHRFQWELKFLLGPLQFLMTYYHKCRPCFVQFHNCSSLCHKGLPTALSLKPVSLDLCQRKAWIVLVCCAEKEVGRENGSMSVVQAVLACMIMDWGEYSQAPLPKRYSVVWKESLYLVIAC